MNTSESFWITFVLFWASYTGENFFGKFFYYNGDSLGRLGTFVG